MVGWYETAAWRGSGIGSSSATWWGLGMFWLLVVALLAWVLWMVFKVAPTVREQTAAAVRSGGTPEEALDRRFADGEIDADTYRERRATLATARGGEYRSESG
jgi:putative membrane protein